ncbi:MAG: hypothetical protein AAFX87_04330 [Bacteroidota bacterium]
MRKLSLLLSGFALFGVLLISSCGDDDGGETESERQTRLLTTPTSWTLSSVTLDGVPVDGWNAFTINVVNGSSVSTANAVFPGPWSGSHTWEFGTSVTTQIVRDPGSNDELAVTYSVTETTLQLQFQFEGDGFTSRVEGNWVFNMTAQ